MTRSGNRSAYASASVTPHDAPHTSQRSIPRCSRSRSMSAIRWWVVLVDRSVDEVAGVGRAQAAAALVELDQAVAVGVEPAAPAGAAAAARPAVERDRRACRPGCPTPPSRSTGRRRRRACPVAYGSIGGNGRGPHRPMMPSGRRRRRAPGSRRRRYRRRQPAGRGRDADHRDEAAGLLRVVGEVRQRRHVLVPQPVALGAVGDHRRGRRAGAGSRPRSSRRGSASTLCTQAGVVGDPPAVPATT